MAGVALLRYVLLCGALGCISAAIASPGTSFGVLQGAWRALWKVVRVSLLLLGASLGALRERLRGILEPLWGLLRYLRQFELPLDTFLALGDHDP